MNEAIVKNWNNIIDNNDEIYVLGDLMLNDDTRGLYLLKQLKGHLHIIRGNHDSDRRIELYKTCFNIMEVSEGQFFKYDGYNFYLSHYPCLCANMDNDKPLKRRMISLCGHSHTDNKFADMDKGLIYHVELDAHNCMPINIDTIIEDIKNYIGEE